MSKANTDQVIKIDGTTISITPQNPKKGYSLQEMYRAIDTDMVQIVSTNQRNTIMVCDEEAMFNNKSYNAMASMIAGQAILGDVIVCNTKNVK
jgi:hypothetical protein